MLTACTADCNCQAAFPSLMYPGNTVSEDPKIYGRMIAFHQRTSHNHRLADLFRSMVLVPGYNEGWAKRTSITISESIGNPYLKPNDTNSIRNPWSPFDLNDSLIFHVIVVVSMLSYQ